MARETRGSAKPPPSPGIKRKRSHSPVKPEPSLKLVLPSPASLAKNHEPENDAKRQKITLKLYGRSSPEKEKTPPESPEKVASLSPPQTSPTKVQVNSTPLGEELRGALSLIISQMAVQLPPPMNNILTLWLPPDFKQTEENTLGHVLSQDSLTWESLITLLHVFCENLLVPCSYPNPMPSLERFHVPVPPLASHYPPHAIYNFCASLYTLMARIQPTNIDASSATRWALMQSTPQGEVFTSPADVRIEDATAKKLGVQSLLESLAGATSLGSAVPVTVTSAIASSSRPTRTLNESLLRRASLKMTEWKRKSGSFGSIVKGVTPLARDTWTPSFAPTYDSSQAVGAGFYSTIDAAYEHAWHRKRGQTSADTGWYGLESYPPETMDEVLAENATLIDELQAWQEYRARTGPSTPSEREQLAAEQLVSSLSRLAAGVTPADLVDTSTGLPHALAGSLSTSSPSIRGTLDARRPRAVHENTTSRTQTISSPVRPYRPASPQTPFRPSFTANPVGNTIYGKSSPSYPVRPNGPGPSNLRQSFAPYRPVL